jgi:hypothetical protein
MNDVAVDEKISRYFWHILNELKEKSLIKGTKIIEYHLVLYPKSNDWKQPNSTIEQLLIDRLIKLGVMKETGERIDFQIGKNNDEGNPESAGMTYSFKLREPNFSKYYDKYKRLVEQYDRSNKDGDTLIFYEDGNICYISPEGKIFKTKLRITSNPYKVLSFLVNNKRRLYTFDELTKHCFDIDRDPESERRIRSSIGTIKKMLKYQGNDIFETNKGYKMKCKIQIRK